MKIMISGIVPGRSLGMAAAALLSVTAFSAATPARAQASADSNVLNSMLGFVGMQPDKDQDSIDYRARPPIVVPPRTDLPPPKAAVRDPSWPKDPDVAEARRAALDSRRPAPQTTSNTRTELSQTDLQQGKSALPADGPPDECQAGGGVGICLSTPWKVLKSMVTGVSALDTLPPGPEPQRKYLTEPPPGYRQATGNAKANTAPAKDTPDATGPGNYFTSQLPKTPGSIAGTN